jgi:hypothetical protein
MWWRAKELTVYRRTTEGLTEIARLARCCLAEDSRLRDIFEFDVKNPEDILRPDESGTRRLSAEEHLQRQTTLGLTVEKPVTATVSIDSLGKVTVSQGPAAGPPPQVQAAEGNEPADPVSLMTMTSVPFGVAWWKGEEPAESPPPGVTVEVPAGAVPAGWTVSQAVWSPDREYVAVVTSNWQVTSDWQWLQGNASQLSIYSLRGGRLRELWREVNTFVVIDEELAFKDINGDGNAEIVYGTTTGGNGFTWHPVLAATLTGDGSVQDVAFQLPILDSAPEEPIDVEGDGVYEWLAIDASWELKVECFGHADSPGSWFVLAWDGQQYVDATKRYPQAVDAQHAKVAGIGLEELDPVPEKGAFLSQSVSRFLDYFNSGRSDDANRILNRLRGYTSFGNLSATRDWIVRSLELNPHSGPQERLPASLGCP